MTADTINRRTLLKMLGCGGCVIASANLTGCTVAEVFGTGSGFDFNLDEAQFRPLKVVNGVVAIDTGGRNVLLIRSSEDTIVALGRLCTHTSCDLAPDKFGTWDGEKITCGCHGAQFDGEGKVLQGPAARDLPNYPVKFKNGNGDVTVNFGGIPMEESGVPEEFRGMTNPLDDNAEAVTAGEVLYGQCSGCHGVDGAGNPGFMPPASAFNIDQTALADDYLFWRIRTGSASGPMGSIMPAYPDMSEDDVWKVVSYIRTLAK